MNDLTSGSLDGDTTGSYPLLVEKTPGQIFGRHVKRLREAWDIDQGEFARSLGVTQGALSDWERGRRPGVPEGSTLLKFAKLLKCRVDDLLVGIDHDYDTQLPYTPLKTEGAGDIVRVPTEEPLRSVGDTRSPSGRSSGGDSAAMASGSTEALHPSIRQMLLRIAAVIQDTVSAGDESASVGDIEAIGRDRGRRLLEEFPTDSEREDKNRKDGKPKRRRRS